MKWTSNQEFKTMTTTTTNCMTLLVLSLALRSPLGFAQEDRTDTEMIVLGFEDGKRGELPAKWFVPTRGWKGELWDQDASQGICSARLSLPGESEAPFGNLMRTMDATPYRGKHVRLAAKVRVEGVGARAMMWLRVDRPQGRMGFFDNMGDRPVVAPKWTAALIDGEIDADAERLALGVMSLGGGTVYVDEMSLTVSAGVPLHARPPRGN